MSTFSWLAGPGWLAWLEPIPDVLAVVVVAVPDFVAVIGSFGIFAARCLFVARRLLFIVRLLFVVWWCV